MDSSSGQLELGFGQADGLASWRRERDAVSRQAAADLGMPIGRQVEIWLRGGIRLRGVLRLRESVLVLEENGAWKLELEVDRVTFQPAEVESCVRLD